MKNSSETIGNGTRELPTCSAVPQPNALPACPNTPFPPYVLRAPAIILLDLITRSILGEEYRLLSSSLCSYLHSTVTSSHLGPTILLNTLTL